MKGDQIIWLILLLLSIASVLAVYSASGSLSYKVGGVSTESYLLRQVSILLVGFGVAYFVQNIHYTIFGKLSTLFLVLSALLLLYTQLYGLEINDARRWIRVPLVNMSFQTSDLAKLSLIVYLGYKISMEPININVPKFFMGYILLPIVIICGLIMPSDFSSAAMLFATCFILLVIAGVDFKLLGLILFLIVIVSGTFLALGTFFESIRSETWINRMANFLGESGEGYQITQAKIAIAEGGLFGEGPGNSVQRNFLPSPYSDFIFAIIIEEYGLLGGFSLMGIYLFFLVRCIKIVTRSTRTFAALLTVGISISLVMQAMLNMAVSVDLVPVTGLNLPIVSKGGTSAIFNFLAIGMVLSVSHFSELQRKKDEEEQEQNSNSEESIQSPKNPSYESHD